MMPVIVHQGDDLPPIYARLLDGESGTVIDLSAATTVISAKFKLKGSTTVLNTITCTKPFGGTDGWCQMDWGSTQLDITSGRYEIEIAVAFNGAIQTVNRYYWLNGMHIDDSKTLPVRVRDDF